MFSGHPIFCRLHEFTEKPLFDPSLFVTIRKRISEEELNKMTVKLLDKQKRLLEEKRKREEEEAKKNGEDPPTPKPEDSNAASFTDSQGREHKGGYEQIIIQQTPIKLQPVVSERNKPIQAHACQKLSNVLGRKICCRSHSFLFLQQTNKR